MLAGMLWAAACDRAPTPAPQVQGSRPHEVRSAPVPPASAPAPALPALRTESWIVELEVPGFGSAVLVPPQGTRAPRPVVVALHGYGDRPDWQCGAWTGVTEARVFVVCPRGIALPNPPGNFAFGSLLDTEREVFAVLRALEARFAGYVGRERALVGFSLGASRAAQLAARNPKQFPRVALVEGGSAEWSQACEPELSRRRR